MISTYHEVESILDMKHIDAENKVFLFPPGIKEVREEDLKNFNQKT